MLKEIIQIVASVTGLGAPDYMPPIVRVDSAQDMEKKCVRGANACFAVRGGFATIYMSGKLMDDRTGVRDAAIAHEMAHFFQYHHGQFDTFQCHKESEYAAYRAGNHVLIDRGIKPHSNRQIERFAKCD